GAAFALPWPLVGDGTEELALCVIAAALVPVVGGHRHVIVGRHADDVRIGERERTARDAVVSGTPERMPVHLPQENRLALLPRDAAGLREVHQPRDRRPRFFPWTRLDERLEFGELVGRYGVARAPRTDECHTAQGRDQEWTELHNQPLAGQASSL